MKPIINKEIQYYLNNPIGYIILALFGIFINFLFVKDLFVNGAFSLQTFFALIPWIYLIFIPALGMRIFSEEKRLNTLEVLLALPVSETQIVLAKFFSLVFLVCISLVLTLSIPVSVNLISHLYLPEVVVGYCGAVLIGGAFISLTMLFSVRTKNQIVAFLLSVLTIFVLMGLSSDLLATILPKSIQDILIFFGPLNHYQNFAKGILDVRSIFYFVCIIVLSLFATIIDLEKRS
ncbi:hypothetical protein COY90_02930 [Candidatus Roizmanbacteria bacterium CG_4_10_14_0_8_um_filter_39_9]|uniref:ABC transporter n=1 Tax=Candidatus Roizmanbacteria bacterium CG_4_10_14_0_8_um_filter_39_9 TaxID=1974829 RepID=A0A2M7QDQ7_9BACT|nr:MAG: hypothetical protein COY90_02930 [Candidatus Roizmanbacteria bacterium CG_4_10_14_0_8_um_filter_39_9]